MGVRVVRGVKKRPTTANGSKVVSVVYAIFKKRFFAVVRTNTSYAVETINKDGSTSKRHVKGLCDRVFSTKGQARGAILIWDLTV